MILTDKISVDIISDVMCPWCLVGYKRFEKALKELGVEDKFQITWHPFELNPDISDDGEELLAHLSKKYGMSLDDAKATQDKFKESFDEVGFPFTSNDNRRMVKTIDAHILLDFAKNSGKQTELKLALFKAHFNDSKDVSKKEVLEEIVKSVGLDVQKAMAKLDDSESRGNIKDKEMFWLQRGINTVPSMVFNQQSMINGAYPVENYKQIINDLLNSKN